MLIAAFPSASQPQIGLYQLESIANSNRKCRSSNNRLTILYQAGKAEREGDFNPLPAVVN
jgi:hypothetical protein